MVSPQRSRKPNIPKIGATTKAHQAWEILETTYQGTNKVKISKLQTLRKKLETLEMKDIESIDQLMTQAMNVVNQLYTHGETVTDKKVVEKALISLPTTFDMVVTVMEESKDLAQSSIE